MYFCGRRKVQVPCVAVSLMGSCFFALTLSAPASNNYLLNGDFEQTTRPFAHWHVSAQDAELDIHRPAGRWIPVIVTFNSEDCSRVVLYIGAYGTPSGRCWVDNLRPKGFEVKNPSFENLTPDGKSFVGWDVDHPGEWVHVSRERVSEGRVSVRYQDPSSAAEMIRLSQAVEVKPHTDYSYTYDFYMDDDFYGAIRCSVLAAPPAAYRVLRGDYQPLIDDLIADRATAGNQQCRMRLAGGQVSLSQEARLPAGAFVEAGISVKTKDLAGSVMLVASDETGRVLARTSMGDTGERWESRRIRFVAPQNRARFRIEAIGKGEVLLDGAFLSRPVLRPAVQWVKWLPSADAYTLPDLISVCVEGKYGEVLQTGLTMLRKDLAGIGVTFRETPRGEGRLVIRLSDHTATVPAKKGEDAYHLAVTHSGIIIDARTERGAFYGIMTLLQLFAARPEGAPVAIGCQINDWPDLPWRTLCRGAPGLTPEWMARRKLNVAFHINPPEMPEWRRYGILPVPHDNITHYPYANETAEVLKNPNFAEGVGREDRLVLAGEGPVDLKGRNVLRTNLTDIVVRSEDGKITYADGGDYRVIPGELRMSKTEPTSFSQDSKPFAVARIAGGRIGNGQTVVVRYEHVDYDCGELCLAELEPQRFVAQRAKDLVAAYDLPFIGLHVSESPACVGKGPRCQATGLSAPALLARYYARLDQAIKQANPQCRMLTFTDDLQPWQNAPRSGLADLSRLLPKDAIAHCWDYNASQAVAFNVKCAKLWSGLGHDFLLTGWYDYRNLHIVAAAAKWARAKGMPCLGTSSWAYNPDRTLDRPGDFIEETAACAWRVPQKGEAGYVAPAEFDAMLKKVNADSGGRPHGKLQ